MKLLASRFRAELFERAGGSRGKDGTVTYKGREYGLVMKRDEPSKFAQVKRSPGAVVDGNVLKEQSPWDEADRNAKWEKRLPPKGVKSLTYLDA